MRIQKFLDKVNEIPTEQLRKHCYINDVTSEDTEQKVGNFSLIYVRDMKYAYGVSFIENQLLQVYDFEKCEVLLECLYNPQRKSWVVQTVTGAARTSSIIDFAKKMKELLV